MIRTVNENRILCLLALGVLSLTSGLGGGGCTREKVLSCDPASVANPWLGPVTIAVAPALNFSGSTDFDPATVADLMASEWGYVEGVNVIPVNRVLAVMARMGIREVGSPDEALEIRSQLGADAILVFAVTEYDPYDPPVIGLAAQLYGQSPRWPGDGGLDPILVSRQARPFAVSVSSTRELGLITQTQRVFNAAHDYVVQQVRGFAEHRGHDDSAFGWRLYLVSQQHYVRFCCSAVIQELVRPPAEWTSAGITEEEPISQ
jgi:hypothetical protein